MALVASLLTFAPTSAKAVAPTCAQGGVCQVGDIGPGGGIVYFVATTSFVCGPNLETSCLYLEVAPKNWGGGSSDPTLYWNDTYGEIVSGISRDATPNMDVSQIGLGLKNSNLMAAADTSTASAAVATRAYTGGSKSDWYLPTLAEARLLCQYAHGQTRSLATACDYNQALNTGVPSSHTFSSASYQSSSQSDSAGSAQWHANFVSGGSDGNTAEHSTWGYAATLYATRAIRAFGPEPTVISVAAIGGLTAPVRGGTPVSTVTSANGYTGTVSWSGSPQTFAASETYTATITLTPASGYTLSGVTANFFTVSGATTVTHDANSGVITAVFPATGGKSSQTVTWAPTTSLAITASPATPSALATTSGDGTISYAVTSVGTTGCSVNSSTGVVTYTALGSCQVTATAASTTNFNSATAAVTFVISKAIRTITIDPTSYTSLYYSYPGSNVTSPPLPRITTLLSAGTGNVGLSGTVNVCTVTPTGQINLFRPGTAGWCSVVARVFEDANYALAATNIQFRIARAQTLRISYDNNGAQGTLAKAFDSYLQGTDPVTLPGAGTMSKAGFTFAGWSETGAIPVISGAYTPTGNVTLKAVWTPTSYTVTYDRNGGNSTPTQASRTIGQTFILADAITKNDANSISYAFAGWNNGSSIFQAGETITVGSANLNYSAAWVEQFEVTYASNGGTFAGSDTDKDSQCLGTGNKCSANQAITLNSAPTRAGYTFAGWKDQSGSLVSDLDPAVANVQTTVTTSSYIYTASWTPISYTVTYVSDGSSAPTQSALTRGQTFTIGAAVTKANLEFAGWSDGSSKYWPDSIYVVGSSNITLTAQWISLSTVTYSAGSGAGTPPTDSNSYRPGDVFDTESDPGLTRAGFTFAGWSDGTTTYQEGATYTVGSSNVTLTAQWTAIVVTSTPAPVVAGPPPSTIKTVTAPKISRDATNFICTPGTYVFVRNGYTEEAPKLTSQTYSLLQDGKVVDSITSALVEVKFEIKGSYMNSTMSCAVQVGQENLISTVSSISSKVISEANKAKLADLDRVEAQYVADRTAAYSNKDKEFARLEALKKIEMASAKSSAAILLVSAEYRKAFTAATDLWKVELKAATTNRDAGRLAAQATYLKTLETAGASIYPQEVKPVVTPTPTPTVTPKPTPSPTQTSNPQPTAQMEKVGTVYMASGSYFLNDATKLTMKALALKINASGAKSILVYGHTDNRGGVNNTVLSQNRAKAVANYLRPLLTSKKISIGWYASKKPVAGGTSAAALALNRRVEIYTK